MWNSLKLQWQAQEIWDEVDYEFLKRKLSEQYPYSQYFQSGLVGAGTCIFTAFVIRVSLWAEQWFYSRCDHSKYCHPSIITFMYPAVPQGVHNHVFSVNGWAHQVWRGDGLAGAGLGCVRVTVSRQSGDDLSILLGVTHFHSQYQGDDVSVSYNRKWRRLQDNVKRSMAMWDKPVIFWFWPFIQQNINLHLWDHFKSASLYHFRHFLWKNRHFKFKPCVSFCKRFFICWSWNIYICDSSWLTARAKRWRCVRRWGGAWWPQTLTWSSSPGTSTASPLSSRMRWYTSS